MRRPAGDSFPLWVLLLRSPTRSIWSVLRRRIKTPSYHPVFCTVQHSAFNATINVTSDVRKTYPVVGTSTEAHGFVHMFCLQHHRYQHRDLLRQWQAQSSKLPPEPLDKLHATHDVAINARINVTNNVTLDATKNARINVTRNVKGP